MSLGRAQLPKDDPKYLEGTKLQKLSHGKRYITKTVKTALWDERFSLEDLENIDLTKVVEMEDNTDLKGEVACGAGGCEVCDLVHPAGRGAPGDRRG